MDLRGEGGRHPDEWGMVVRRQGLIRPHPRGPQGHCDETFDRFRELIRDGGRRPLLVHCSSANRVGALLIPYLILDEKSMTRRQGDRRRGGPQEQQAGAGGVALRECQVMQVC